MSASGRKRPCRPLHLDLRPFCDLQGVVQLNSQISDGALKLRVTKEQLHGSDVLCRSIDEARFGAPQRVRPIRLGLQPSGRGPTVHDSRILPGGQVVPRLPTWKQEVRALQRPLGDQRRNGGAGLVGHLELNRPTGLSLHNDCPRRHPVLPRYVPHLEIRQVAAAQLAVYSEVEKCEIPQALRYLQPYANRNSGC
jgi:hypothetical protein